MKKTFMNREKPDRLVDFLRPIRRVVDFDAVSKNRRFFLGGPVSRPSRQTGVIAKPGR